MGEGLLHVGTGISWDDDPRSAAHEAVGQAMEAIKGLSPSLTLVFCSPRYAREEVREILLEATGNTPLLGCTTAGEILDGPRDKSLVVVVLSSMYLKAHLAHTREVSKDPKAAASAILGSAPLSMVLDPEWRKGLTSKGGQAFAIMFGPGNTKSQDSVTFSVFRSIKEVLGDSLTIVGACAADEWNMEQNYVVSSQGVFPDSIAIAVIETSLKFGLGMYHSFLPTERRALVTKTRGQTILEMNGAPAHEVLPWLFQKELTELASSHIAIGTGKVLGIQDRFGRYFLVTPTFLTKEGGLRIGQELHKGTSVTVMEPGPNLAVTAREALTRALVRANTREPVFGLVFSCALQWKIAGDRREEEYRLIREGLGNIKLAGFYSFGEEGLSMEGVNRHCNGAAAAMILFDELTDSAKIYNENQKLIQKLKINQKELQRGLQEWRETFDSAPLGIMILDTGYRILRMNQFMAKWLGIKQGDGEGRLCYELVHGLKEPHPKCPLKTLYEDAKPSIVEMYQGLLKGWYLVSVSPIRDRDGTIKAATHFCLDITDRKQFDEARERIKRLEVANTFANGIAHDFNNLLSIVMGNVELALLTLEESSRARQYLQRIKDSLITGSELVRRLLSSTEKLSINPVKSDLEVLLRTALRDSFKGSGVLYEVIIDDVLPPVILDPSLISQTLRNIFINAIEANKGEGQVSIRLRKRRLYPGELPSLAPGTYAEVSIKDQGPGIAPEHLDKLFDPYFSTKRRGTQKGMGLGLTEALSNVRAHGGTILVDSEEGTGTDVHILIPIQPQ